MDQDTHAKLQLGQRTANAQSAAVAKNSAARISNVRKAVGDRLDANHPNAATNATRGGFA